MVIGTRRKEGGLGVERQTGADRQTQAQTDLQMDSRKDKHTHLWDGRFLLPKFLWLVKIEPDVGHDTDDLTLTLFFQHLLVIHLWGWLQRKADVLIAVRETHAGLNQKYQKEIQKKQIESETFRTSRGNPNTLPLCKQRGRKQRSWFPISALGARGMCVVVYTKC